MSTTKDSRNIVIQLTPFCVKVKNNITKLILINISRTVKWFGLV